MNSTPCYGPECSRNAVKKGLCDTHYQQKTKRLNGELTPIGSKWICKPAASLVRDVQGRKRCTTGHWVAEASFHKDRTTSDGLEARCKGCRRASIITRTYNISLDDYDSLWDAQNGRCAACLSLGADRSLCVDHDHSCCPSDKSCGNCVRGLLCTRCNALLGSAQDEVNVLKGCLAYLETHVKP
jgi:hypothetical protein